MKKQYRCPNCNAKIQRAGLCSACTTKRRLIRQIQAMVRAKIREINSNIPSPCDNCYYNPPSYAGDKPCNTCPAKKLKTFQGGTPGV